MTAIELNEDIRNHFAYLKLSVRKSLVESLLILEFYCVRTYFMF